MLDNVRLTLVLSKCVSLTESIIANQGRHCLCGAEISLFVAIRLHAIHLCQIPWHWAQVAFIWTKDNWFSIGFNCRMKIWNKKVRAEKNKVKWEMQIINEFQEPVNWQCDCQGFPWGVAHWLSSQVDAQVQNLIEGILCFFCFVRSWSSSVYTKPTAVPWMHL